MMNDYIFHLTKEEEEILPIFYLFYLFISFVNFYLINSSSNKVHKCESAKMYTYKTSKIKIKSI